MARAFVLLAVLAACGSERTPVTSKVTTLGYSHPPLVVVVGRGPANLVEPWIAGMRASKHLHVVAELMKPEAETEAETVADPQATCREAREAANGAPIEEVIVLAAEQTETPIDECSGRAVTQPCAHEFYMGQTVRVTTTVTSYRASTCAFVRQTSLPLASGISSSRTPIAHGAPSNSDEPTLDDAKSADLLEARTLAIARLDDFAPKVSWNVFPTSSSIQRIEGDTILIAGPLKIGEYFLKTPSDPKIAPGIRAVRRTTNSTTLQFDRELPTPEPGDELHAVTDMITVAGFTSISAGTATANGKKHGIGGAALAARWSWDHSPGMFEFGLAGDLVPGVDSRRVGVHAAGGLRAPYWISPVVFVELGLGAVYQGDHGARAVAGHAGVGAGLEVRRSRWFAFADMRLRAFALSDWKDSEDNELDVTYTDQTWQTMTGQLGLGINY